MNRQASKRHLVSASLVTKLNGHPITFTQNIVNEIVFVIVFNSSIKCNLRITKKSSGCPMDGAIVVLWQIDLKVRLTKIINSPSRTALVRDPYARWCGRRGVETRLPQTLGSVVFSIRVGRGSVFPARRTKPSKVPWPLERPTDGGCDSCFSD